MRNLRRGAGLICAFLVFASVAEAGSTAGAFSLQIPPSARNEGMGRAYHVLDQGPMAAWGNVGGLAFAEGLQGALSYSRLAEGLSDDAVRFYYGTVSMQAKLPGDFATTFDINFARLDYGESALIDGSSTRLGTFSSHEDTYGGAGALQIGDRLGIGVGFKVVQIDLLDGLSDALKDQLGLQGGEGSSVAFDLGALGRFPVSGGESGQVAMNVLAGVTVKNLGADISLTDDEQSDPLPRNLQAAVGFDLSAIPLAELGMPEDTGLGFLLGDASLMGVSFAMGFEKSLVSSDIPDSVANELSFLERHDMMVTGGGEVRLLDCLALRAGYLRDEPGGIEDWTWGVGISAFRWGGMDFASIPQALDLPRVKKWSVWFRVPLS